MPRPTVNRNPFGAHGNTDVDVWTLDSGAGVRAEILTYGGILHRLTVPDTAGAPASVVRSLPGLDDYTGGNPFFGALIGRFANRIAYGRFTLDEAEYQVPATDRGHALHGGPGGFHTRVWQAAGEATDAAATLRLTLHSADGDMGFPGALDVTVTYALDAAGTLALDYTATTDRPTVVNLTNHAYFDLAAQGDIRGHTLQVDADSYLPVDEDGIPEGPATTVHATPFDLTAPCTVGERIALPDEQLRRAGASTTAGSSALPGRDCAGPPVSPPPGPAGSWRCGPPNPASRSTPPTSSTAPSPPPAAGATTATAPSAWRPSTCPTRPTGRTTPAPSCARTKSSAAGPSSGSRTSPPSRAEPPAAPMKRPGPRMSHTPRAGPPGMPCYFRYGPAAPTFPGAALRPPRSRT